MFARDADSATRVLDIATGDEYACAKLQAGTVWCWGNDHDGTFGAGMDGMPRQIPIARVAQMFARPSGMFFLDQEGTTWHWGYEERQRVLDPKVPRRLPVPPSTRISVSDHELCHEPKASSGARCTALASLIVQPGLTNDVAWREALPAPLQALTAGAARHCGIAEGKVLCFGAGEAAHPVASPVASSEGARDVAIVGEHACFLDTAGRLHCEPSKGQSAGLSTEGTFQALRSSPHALCALSQAGTPSCFDRELKALHLPEHIATAPDALSLSPSFGCMLEAGAVTCWGDNRSDVLGANGVDLEATAVPQPIEIGALERLASVRDVATNGDHVCVAVDGGDVLCWGDNEYGQLGVGDRRDRSGPTPVPGLSDVVQLSMDGASTCALSTDGTLRCWGIEAPPAIGGQASLVDCSSPYTTNRCALQPLLVAEGVTALGNGPCIVQGGELHCWEGGWEVHERPYRWVVRATAGTLPAVRKLVTTGEGGYALTEDGQLFGWGDNRNRDQGRGFVSADEYPQATRIEGIEGLVDIDQNSALTKEGRLLVWGFNFDATFPLEQEHIYRPTALGGLCDAKALAGHYQTCVLRGGGTVVCWGGRGYDGDRWHDLVYEVKLPPVARLINGGETTCAITTQGALHCWSGFLENGVQIGTPELVLTAFPQPTAQCPAQVPAAIEAYPGVAYDRVESYSHDGRCASVLNGPCGSLKRGKDLSPKQIDAVLALVNDPASYSRMSIHCFTPRHELVFRDAQGAAVASMQICFECHRIDFMPAVPAREVTGGRDPVGKVMRHLRSLCQALDLERCSKP